MSPSTKSMFIRQTTQKHENESDLKRCLLNQTSKQNLILTGPHLNQPLQPSPRITEPMIIHHGGTSDHCMLWPWMQYWHFMANPCAAKSIQTCFLLNMKKKRYDQNAQFPTPYAQRPKRTTTVVETALLSQWVPCELNEKLLTSLKEQKWNPSYDATGIHTKDKGDIWPNGTWLPQFTIQNLACEFP